MRNALLSLPVCVMCLGGANAAVITFDSADSNGQASLPSSYQPLLNGTPGDGAALGITIGWGGLWTSSRSYNGGVTDHTPGSGGQGVVGFDGGAQSITLTFSAPVVISSFYFANYNGGSYSVDFRGYTRLGDVTPVLDVPVNYNEAYGYDWKQETAFANTPIQALSFSGGLFKQLDDITVFAAVPEPASLALIGGALLGLSTVRRRSSTDPRT